MERRFEIQSNEIYRELIKHLADGFFGKSFRSTLVFYAFSVALCGIAAVAFQFIFSTPSIYEKFPLAVFAGLAFIGWEILKQSQATQTIVTPTMGRLNQNTELLNQLELRFNELRTSIEKQITYSSNINQQAIEKINDLLQSQHDDNPPKFTLAEKRTPYTTRPLSSESIRAAAAMQPITQGFGMAPHHLYISKYWWAISEGLSPLGRLHSIDIRISSGDYSKAIEIVKKFSSRFIPLIIDGKIFLLITTTPRQIDELLQALTEAAIDWKQEVSVIGGKFSSKPKAE